MASQAQIDADAAFARRLQMEQDGLMMGQFGVRPSSRDQMLPRRQRGGPRTGDVRMHIATDVLQQQVGRRPTNYKMTAITTAIVNMPQVIVGAYVLLNNWDPGACDKPLHMWCAIACARLLVHTAIACMMYRETSHDASQFSDLAKAAHCMKYPLDIFGLFWFVFGNVWLLTTATCEENASAVYSLATALVVIQYAILLLPCILIALLIPVACCCLPCFLRLARMHNPMGTKGAQAVQINKLPSSKFEDLKLGEGATCSICLCEYEAGEDVRTLPCGGNHHFHKACVDEWLQVNATCPQCRGKVFDDNGKPRPPGSAPAATAADADADTGAGAGAGAGPGAGDVEMGAADAPAKEDADTAQFMADVAARRAGGAVPSPRARTQSSASSNDELLRVPGSVSKPRTDASWQV